MIRLSKPNFAEQKAVYIYTCVPFGEFMLEINEVVVHLTAHVIQNWPRPNCRDLIKKVEWLPNSPNLNLLDHHVKGEC